LLARQPGLTIVVETLLFEQTFLIAAINAGQFAVRRPHSPSAACGFELFRPLLFSLQFRDQPQHEIQKSRRVGNPPEVVEFALRGLRVDDAPQQGPLHHGRERLDDLAGKLQDSLGEAVERQDVRAETDRQISRCQRFADLLTGALRRGEPQRAAERLTAHFTLQFGPIRVNQPGRFAGQGVPRQNLDGGSQRCTPPGETVGDARVRPSEGLYTSRPSRLNCRRAACKGRTRLLLRGIQRRNGRCSIESLPRCLRRIGRSVVDLCEQPLQDSAGVTIGLAPTVVSDAGEFGIKRLSARVAESLNHLPRILYGNDFVGLAMDGPNRDAFESHGLGNVTAATDRDNARESLGVSGRQFPRSEAAHRQAGQVDSLLVHREIMTDPSDEKFQIFHPFRPVAGFGALRGQQEAGKPLPPVGLDHLFGETSKLFLIVSSPLAGSVEENQQGKAARSRYGGR
jgi:hypothetical protein